MTAMLAVETLQGAQPCNLQSGAKVSVIERIRRRNPCFRLPGGPQDVLCIPMSGGMDSTAMAILVARLFPERNNIVYLFTDTDAEHPGIYRTLDQVEAYLGITIQRVEHPFGLWGLIERWGGYLPSGQSRWCTRDLKTKPFEQHMKALIPENGKVYSLIGLRADEKSRIGLISRDDRIVTETPYKDLGVTHEEVIEILEETVGVPSYYRHRTRSGCSTCWGMRRSEVVALHQWDRSEFERGMAYEKLADADVARYARLAKSLWQEAKVSENHTTFPIPSSWEPSEVKAPPRRKLVEGGIADIFDADTVSVFVGAEFLVNPAVGGDGVWWRDIVTFSTTKGGLSRQLNMHYHHRLKTAATFGLSREAMARELRLVVYEVRLPAHLVYPKGPTKQEGDKNFTWRTGDAYAQIQHVLGWVKRTLNVEAMHQEIRRFGHVTKGWLGEQVQSTREAFQKLHEPVGTMAGVTVFSPSYEEPEEDEREITCLACSI